MELKLIIELDTSKHQPVPQQLPSPEHQGTVSMSAPSGGSSPAQEQHKEIKSGTTDKWDWICVGLTILCLWQIAIPSPQKARRSETPTFAKSPSVKTAPAKYAGKLVFPLGRKSFATTRITDLPGSPRPNGRIHAGIDLAAYQNDVVAVLPGAVVELKPDSRVGGIIGIESKWRGKTVKLRYVHLERGPLRSFSLGDKVQAGQKLSYIKSNFPGSSGPHLDLEVYVNGELQWRPQDFLKLAVVNR
ncbi:peptidoglycan DD-metalloendopeptidase family protein [Argonema antarcticum]|uniref:peptidoglycan DD-metalloendopeptidase family protein n=1 Tax=Argonema antarcticum TaxID=2942763 RepID=UPI0020134E40|nr:M23 family metallopeptidase [Argonema antarcticum A004/B2]